MKVLFLDFDGVLHPMTEDERGRYPIGRPFVHESKLANCLENSNVKIVISSTWRRDGLAENKKSLPMLAHLIFDSTKIEMASTEISRYEEIMEYVDRYSIKDWRALDDDIAPFGKDKRLIACDPAVGLTNTQLGLISLWLNV